MEEFWDVFVGNVKNRSDRLALDKGRHDELGMEEIQLVQPRAPWNCIGNSQQRVGGKQRLQHKAVFRRNLLRGYRVGVVEKKLVVTSELGQLADQFPIISFVAALVAADAVNIDSDPEWLHSAISQSLQRRRRLRSGFLSESWLRVGPEKATGSRKPRDQRP